jgi:regulator of protease activity HflC (stomatin/prohibitin superfamily)
VWTINRADDGPMKAYKNLGSDLSSDEPKTANALISNMASAVIRNEIANKTMMEIMADRETMKELIVKNLMTVC